MQEPYLTNEKKRNKKKKKGEGGGPVINCYATEKLELTIMDNNNGCVS